MTPEMPYSREKETLQDYLNKASSGQQSVTFGPAGGPPLYVIFVWSNSAARIPTYFILMGTEWFEVSEEVFNEYRLIVTPRNKETSGS